MPYPVYAEIEEPYTPVSGSQNAFDNYCLAAKYTQENAQQFIDRVFFTEELKNQAIEAVGPALTLVRSGTANQSEYVHRAGDIFEPHPYRPAWALLGKCLNWQTERQANSGEYSDAIETARITLRFATDLMGGDASDMTLGVELARDARLNIAKHMVSMSDQQLARWETILTEALNRMPDPVQTLRNEEKIMLLGVQYVQDRYVEGKSSTLIDRLGASVDRSVRHLESMKSDKDRAAYFENFAQEARNQVAYEIQRISKPHILQPEGFEPQGERPWRRLTPHLFAGPAQIVDMYREHIVRTRLLMIDAGLRAKKKAGNSLPENLESWGSHAIDPLTGQHFEYHVAASEHKLYGLGENGRDDGGETDRSGWSPDVVPESQL